MNQLHVNHLLSYRTQVRVQRMEQVRQVRASSTNSTTHRENVAETVAEEEEEVGWTLMKGVGFNGLLLLLGRKDDVLQYQSVLWKIVLFFLIR